MEIISFNYLNFSNEMKKVNENINNSMLNNKEPLNQKTIDSLFLSTTNQTNTNFNDLNNSVGFAQVTNGALKNIENKFNQLKKIQDLSDSITNGKVDAFKTQTSKITQQINTLLESTFNGKSLFSETTLSGIKLDTKLPKLDKSNLDEFEDSLYKAQKNTLNFMHQLNDKIQNQANNKFDNIQPKEVDFSLDDIINSHQIDKLKSNFNSLISNF